MRLAEKLSQGFGSKLESDIFDTKKEDKKNKEKSLKILTKNQHQLIFTFEKRKGNSVVLVGRFYLTEKEKKEILKLLKKKLGCGGSINNEFLELQGELKDKIKTILENEGWKFKK